jgi:hypothetical protein
MQTGFSNSFTRTFLAVTLLGSLSGYLHAEVIIGKDLNSNNTPNERINKIFSGNKGTKGGDDQSLQYGDILYGTNRDDVIIGGLGIDILWGKAGNDVLIGGTEDFNPFNQDRAFGGAGDDIFIWAPGDGNDYFNGGDDTDVLILGLIGENKSPTNNTDAAPYFAVSAPGNPGTGDFDGVFLDDTGLPQVNVASGPGFCEIVEKNEAYSDALDALKVDHLIRFVLRGKRSSFLASQETDTPLADDGLRIAMHINEVEFLVCGGEEAGTVKIFDLSVVPYVAVDISQLPVKAQALVGKFL